jgi:hypothetical protein
MQRQLELTRGEEATAQSMAARRKTAQGDFGRAARLSTNRFIFRHKGDIITGRDAQGRGLLTLKLDRLGINAVDPADVTVQTKREPKLPEKFKEGDRVPRVRSFNHAQIFAAVRMLCHIRDRHAKEMGSTNDSLAQVERINAILVSMASKTRDRDTLKEITENLEAIEEMKAYFSAYKDLAFRKLDNVVELLAAADAHGSILMISAACASLTAFRNRMGEWRARQVARIDSYAAMRECSLRLRRDRHIAAHAEGLAERLANDPERATLEILDAERFGSALAMLAENLPPRGWRAAAREGMEAIGKGMPEYTEKKMLRRLYILANAKEVKKDEFTRRLEYVADRFRVRDPAFIAAELEKSEEPYLARTIAGLRAGFLCVQMGRPDDAAQHFRSAIEKI